MKPKRKLNLGCGTDVRQGWVNLDCVDLAGVDIVHDIRKERLPFEDNQFSEILCLDILEHVDYVPVMRELHRVLVGGGMLEIRVPHFSSRFSFGDPTHVRFFSIHTFEHFLRKPRHGWIRNYYFDFHFEKMIECRIVFERRFLFFRLINSILERLVNRSDRIQELYEATFLSRLFPAANIVVKLVK